jgi:hypothetical protein
MRGISRSSATGGALILPALCAAALLLACRSGQEEAAPPEGGSPPATQALDRLRSLPYVDWVPVGEEDRERSGVTRYTRGRAYEGLNLYVARPGPRALLMTMEGEVVHAWSSEAGQPTPTETSTLDFLGGWHHAELTAEGTLLAIVENGALLELDPGSRVIRNLPLAVHHDVAPARDGRLYALAAARLEIEHGGRRLPVLDEEIVVISAGGEVERRVSLYRLLEADPALGPLLRALRDRNLAAYDPSRFARALERLRGGKTGPALERVERRIAGMKKILDGSFQGREGFLLALLRNGPSDLLHANAIEILPADPGGRWGEGALLLSIRNMDLILVLDPRMERILWLWGPGVIERQHQPIPLPSGRILLFDNGTRSRRSRVLEVDPATGGITWTYDGDPPGSFFSPIRGGAEALPNGNVLITDSERGRAFEVTREGEIVWEFYSAHRDDSKRGRAAIYRMARLPEGILKTLKSPGGPR